ncbi:MAG TPA: hypothetical protein VD995_11205 [Azospirillum sp.]|nr:hypothetical protein [Azospirillum sp.]
MTTTVVALYDRLDDARRAVEALDAAGVPRDAVSFVTGDRAAQAAGIGAAVGGAGGLLMGLSALAIPGIGPVLAAGSAVTALAGAGAGAMAGGMVGVLSGFGVPESEMQRYAEGVQRGGALLLVRAEDDRANEVRGILSRQARAGGTRRAAEEAARIEGGGSTAGNDAGSDAESRGADWQTAGWAPFDQRPGPLTAPVPDGAAASDATSGEGRGADWRTGADVPFDQRPGPMTEVHRETGGRPTEGPTPDSTDFGQPGSTPGTRGGTTAFGGVERASETKKRS